jgi:hypothetical protein
MSTFKETIIAAPVLALLLFVSHTFLGPDESQPTIGPTSWLGGGPIPAARFIAKDSITGSASGANAVGVPLEQVSARDLSPQARIRSVFAQFASGGRRPAT